METVLIVTSLLMFGSLVAALVFSAKRLAGLRAEVAQKDQEILGLKIKLAEVETRSAEKDQAALERMKLLEETKAEMTERFKALSNEALADSLERNQKAIAELASREFKNTSEKATLNIGQQCQSITELLQPLKEAITKIDTRSESTAQMLTKQITSLVDSQKSMAEATVNLKNALQTPSIAGAFGEDQLKRILDAVGLVQGEHYDVKPVIKLPDSNDDLQPDVVVKFTDGTSVVIDSKLPMGAYLGSIEAPTQAERDTHLKKHAEALKTHIRALSGKQYDRALPSYGFTILFVGNEGAFIAALQAEPTLHTYALEKRILLASPTVLLFILHWLASHWKSVEAAENVEEIREIAVALNTVLPEFVAEYKKIGNALKDSVAAFNESASTLDEQVIPRTKEMASLGIPLRKEIKSVKQIKTKIAKIMAADKDTDQGGLS